MDNSSQNRTGFFICPTCDKIFNNKLVLKVHVFEKHDMNRQQQSAENEGKLRDICLNSNTDKALKSPITENTNLSFMKTEVEKNDTEVEIPQSSLPSVNCSEISQDTKFCQVCKLSFEFKKSLQEHIRTVHEKLRLYSCKVCHKNFSRKGSLKSHVN